MQIEHEGGQTYIGGLNRVFHCNYYNAYLQMAILLADDIADFNPRSLLSEAVIPLLRHLKRQGYDRTRLIEEFSYCGFGKLREMLDGKWVTPSSHYGQSTTFHGATQPSCFFTVGYIEGITGRKFEEILCKQQGSSADWYQEQGELHPIPEFLKYPPSLIDPPPRFLFPGCRPFNTDIDETAILEAVSTLPLHGTSGITDTGLIDAFGVVLTNHFADYYNYVSYQSFFAMLDARLPIQHCRDIFIQGGHVCAFNTFGGIMASPEWYSLILPHCRNDEDWVHGMVAVVNALGWGTWRVERIEPRQMLVIRAYNSYEGVGYRRLYAASADKQLSFLLMGAVQGLAHLLWKIDIKQRPQLNQVFYSEVFNDPEGSFQIKQTHAIAAGDPYDRVVVWRD